MSLTDRFHHVALRVPDRDAAARWYEEMLGFTPERAFELPDAGIRIAYLLSPEGLRIELIERTGAPAEGGADHICFEVDDVEAAAEALRARGATLVQEPKHIVPARVKNCWIVDEDGGRIEFLENV